MRPTASPVWTFVTISLAACAASPAAEASTVTDDGPRSKLSLNGEWEVLPVKGLDLRYPPPSTGWQKEEVPHRHTRTISTIGGPYMPRPVELLDEQKTGFKQKEKTAAWFRRSFRVPARVLEGRRAVLRFGGVAFRSDTWLNGKKLGRSFQCTIPFEYDVTGSLKAGAENELLVGVAGREGLTDVENRCFLAPSNGVMAGIWGDVELHFLPEEYIEDVFVRTSVKEKKIELDVTVVNAGRAAAEFRPEAVIRDADGAPECSFGLRSAAGGAVRLPPGSRKVVTLSEDWIAPHLWSPATPVLYSAEVTLRGGRGIVDATRRRFGFREFEIRGRDFFLNGVRTVLLRGSSLTMIGETYQGAIPGARRDVDRPYNSVRLHLGFNSGHQLDLYDRAGILAVPEASWNWTNRFPSAKKEVWLPHVLDYFRGWVRLHRNRPSVVMWSLCNETYWDRRGPEDMEIAEKILAEVRALDPTRPQQGDGEVSWGGRLPVINIHYPESTAGDVREEFPNSGLVVPNDLYWLKDEGENASWRARFVWDRPLVIGEYWWATGEPDSHSSFMGEAAFDWERWRFQKFAGGDRVENPYIETLKMATDYYRMRGVAGINPWSSDRNIVMKPVAVRPADFHPNFYAGRTGVRRVVVFNDTQRGHYRMNLQCRLTVGGRSVWKGVIDVNVPPGQSRTFDVPVEFPAASAAAGAMPTRARLLVRLRYWRAGGMNELDRHEEDVFIVPRESLADVEAERILLVDGDGRTEKALSSLGLSLEAESAPPQAALKRARLVIVGRGTDAAPFGDLLVSFVRGGGRVIVLHQEEWRALSSELPETDDKHAASKAWKRAYGHPVLAGLDDRQFRYWRPDNIVSTKTFYKPATGRFRILLDSGGRYGMQWAPLVEIACDDGLFLLSQLNLVDRLEEEPQAGALLGRMIRHCLSHEAAAPRPLRCLYGKNESLERTLAACSVVTERGLEGDGPILMDSTYAPSAKDLGAVRSYLRGGGNVWLHGFTPETVNTVASLFPFDPVLTPFDKTVQSAARRSDDPLVANLSTHDFFWTRVDVGAREDFFQRGQPTARLGGHVLKLPSLEAGAPLVEPALLVKVPVGKGTLVFDSLLWEDAFGAESDKVARIVSSLVTALGGDIRMAAETEYDYFHVGMSEHATMGYYDPVEGDGRGGWTDQGPNDMRFFLINHTGRAGGREDAPAVGVEEFPGLARFAKRPFALVDPKRNNGRAVITLRGGDHCPFLPSEAKGIRVGRKADRLWFLHTACWAVSDRVHAEVARYTVHYDDGSAAAVPVRFGLEVADWWNPGPLANGAVAWTGKNLAHSPVGVWVSSWENPHPDKTISSVDVTGNLTDTQFVVLAITGGVAADEAKAERTISRWVLGEAEGGVVPNRVAGAAPLRFGKSAPTRATTESRVGLRFRGGQALVTDSRGIPGLFAGPAFSLRAHVAAEAKPSGYYGGIFQCMEYRKSGFRLVQKQDMTVVVEVFPGEDQAAYVQGKTPLKPGRFYEVRAEFDGERGYLFIDGKLDGSADTPPPAPCRSEIIVGTASGKDYHLNGVIAEISIAVPLAREKAPAGERKSPAGVAAPPTAEGTARAASPEEEEAPRATPEVEPPAPGTGPAVAKRGPAEKRGLTEERVPEEKRGSAATVVLVAAGVLVALAAGFLAGKAAGAGSRGGGRRRR